MPSSPPPPPDRQDVPQIAYDEDVDDGSGHGNAPATKLHDFEKLGRQGNSTTRPSLVIVGGIATGRVHALHDAVSTIGRSLACDIVIEDAGVSRHHARIVLTERGNTPTANHTAVVEDLGSSNGIVFRGQRVRSVEVHDGDRIEVGEAAFSILHMDDRFSSLQSRADNEDGVLLSRLRFFELARNEHAFAVKHRSPVALLIFAIDQLPSILEQHGPEVERAAGQRVAQIVRDAIDARPDAKIGRIAHDRVALIVPELTEERAVALGKLVCTTASQARVVNGAIALQLSAGVGSSSPTPTMTTTTPATLASLLEEAELNMYRAILDGRGRCLGSSDR